MVSVISGIMVAVILLYSGWAGVALLGGWLGVIVLVELGLICLMFCVSDAWVFVADFDVDGCYYRMQYDVQIPCVIVLI